MLGPRLDNLPFDILHEVATLLDYRDYIHLSQVNRPLHEAMRIKHISRKIIENRMLYSKEGQQAVNAGTGYYRAITQYHDINEAVATASPYLISVLANGTDFVYQQGILCYCTGQKVRLLDVHQTGQAERVIDFHSTLWRFVPSLRGFDPTQSVELVHYCDDVLAFRVLGNTDVEDSTDLLFAMDVALRHDTPRKKRLLLQAEVPRAASIFVRCDRSCIWYGHATVNFHEGGPWHIHAVDLLSNQTTDYPLDRGLKGDLEKTVCFEIYDETLYAVSTVETPDDAVSKTSFYYWFCYRKSQEQSCHGQLWRRENSEGPIDDLWTNLSMRCDEVTGRPVIVESRREWPGAKSESRRTCYIGPLPTLEEALNRDTDVSWSQLDPAETATERFSTYPTRRSIHSYHTEFNNAGDQDSRCKFITARTKLHSYHLSAATFLDLVNDFTAEDGCETRDCLRIRAVSRARVGPTDENGIGLLFENQAGIVGRATQNSTDQFISRGICLWPSKKLHSDIASLLCLGKYTRTVRAVSDERSIIYSIPSPGSPQGHQLLVLISFDPKIHFINAPTRPTSELPAEENLLQEDPQKKPSIIQVELPLHQLIRRGYWLRPARK